MKTLAQIGTSVSVNQTDDGNLYILLGEGQRRPGAKVSKADLNRFALEILVATGAVGGPFAQPVGDKVGPVTRSGEIDPTPVEEPRIHHVYGNPPAPKLVSSDDPEFHTLSIG